MSQSPHAAKDGSSGFVFVTRTPEELGALSDGDLRDRLRWVRSALSESAGGLDFLGSRTRAIALRERRQLEVEFTRRWQAAREASDDANE